MSYTREEVLAHREEWLKAMESGEYPQTTGRLCLVDDEDQVQGFCCLGLASHLSGVRYEVINTTRLRAPNKQRWYGYEDTGSWTGLPPEAQRWLGLRSGDVFILTPDGQVSAASMNDEGKSFAEIAATLREYGFDPANDLED
jgi:hypothetical protein